jgi:pimeloyl-ACP methyl ester carboxylesterase
MDFSVGTDRWHYNLYGNGTDVLIAFHGYGQDNTFFRHLAECFYDHYIIVAVDLAYHGSNLHTEADFCFNRQYAQQWMSSLLIHLGRQSVGIIGFSLGARLALFIASVCPEKVRELWLLAPDGMPVSVFYRFLTSTWAGHLLFSNFVGHPWLAKFLIGAGLNLRILNAKTAGFFHNEIRSRQHRQQLYNTWYAYRKALPDHNALRQAHLSCNFSVTGILGTRDVVIPFRKTKRWLKRVFPNAILLEPDLGHNLLSEKATKKIMEIFVHKKGGIKPPTKSM